MGVIEDIHAKEPEQRFVEFCMDREIREALSAAQVDLERARRRADQLRGDKDQGDDLRREIDHLDEQVRELGEQAKGRMIRFTFAALEPERFDDLKGEHRPTEPQKTKARKEKGPEPEWNTDTFPPALVAAACVKVESPSGEIDGLSVEDAEAMWKSRSYNDAERAELFNTALGAQLTRTRIELPKGA